MDVGGWLRSLGLRQYEAAFRDNEIDGDVLPKLTVDDLKDLGVAVVGHRRKIMSAIEALNAPSAAPAEAELAPAAQTPAPVDAAERRQLTVMFSDLIGSTALSARLDPEDMRQVIRAYQDAVSGVVARYDGFVAKFMGDGVLAYFGFPGAHEDDAARAVHAGLEIAEAVAALQTRAREKLAVRVGIATGLVVVGDLVGQGSAQEQAVVGDTPNLAARLQGLAEAGGVVVSASTRRLIGDRFRLRDLGKHVVKGLAAPVEAYAALGVSQSESRFEAAHAARLAGFVGREGESADLLARQRRAWGGEGQIVLISGDAGIGKSRLAAWLAEQVAETPHTRLRYQCSPYHRDSALYPFVQQLERAAGIAPQEPAEAKLDKLEKVLGLATDRMGEVAPLIASMLSIPAGTRYPALSLSPAQQRRQTLSALLDQMEGLARKQPLLMLFEDAHWADATSLEVLDLAIERVRRLPVMFIVTSRPEFEAPWKGLPDVAEIALQRFDRAEAEALVERVTGGRKLPAEVLAQIVAKTDGVPLFVEELTKNVLESGLLVEEADRFRLDGPLPPLAIPSTLQDSLMARLDRLAAVKEIAQIGAAIGREFSYPLLNAVVGRDEATLRAALAQLEESELVFRSGEPPAARYTFKHALVQDTAYESLLKSRRQILHQKIAETLREKFPDVAEAEPELLAHHFTQAGLTASAIEYWGNAGDLALRRSAFKEAIAHLGKAIEMTEALAGDKEAETPGGRLKLQVSLGNALMAARGQGAPETQAVFARVQALAAVDADIVKRSLAYFGLWVGSYVRGDLGAMRAQVDVFLRDVSSHPNASMEGVANRLCGAAHWFAGEFAAARVHFDKALALFDPARDREFLFQFSHDFGASAMIHAALARWPLGETDRARRHADDMLARLEEVPHAGTAALANTYAAIFELIRRDPVRAAPRAAALASVARAHEMAQWKAYGQYFEGWEEWRSGAKDVGLSAMRGGMGLLREQKVVVFDPLMKAVVAEAEADRGEFDAAFVALDEAVAESGRTGQCWFDAELQRIRGEILLKQNPADPAPAEEAFLTAIAIAQAQKARSFELRAALSLAKLYRATGRDADAHAVLAPALEGFSPTPEMPEIAEAQALLAAVAQTDAVKTAAAQRRRLTQLQVAYGNALIAARGPGATETTEAFAKARESAIGEEDAPERLAADYALWVGSYVRGELPSMRAHAAAFLSSVEASPDSPEASVAHRTAGITCWFAGEYRQARDHLERALGLFQPGRDDDLAFRFGLDPGVAVMAYLAHAVWPLGEVDRAISLIDRMQTRMANLTHVGTLANGKMFAAEFELMRGDPARAAPNAFELARLAREHDLPMWRAFGVFLEGWATAASGAVGGGIDDMRRGVELLREQNVLYFDGLLKIALAEAEARAGDPDRAGAILDEALATCDRLGYRAFEAELHRARGEILLKRDPSNAAPAEEAFQASVAVARQQGARSFGLRAALSLAKLYRTTGRDADAHAVLRSALEGFAATPEFPEIAEAQALLDALAEIDAVKATVASRKKRVDLHAAYGSALLQGQGIHAPETRAAFERARELAAGDASRPQITFGLWAGAYARGELGPMRAYADALRREVSDTPRLSVGGVAQRVQGVTKHFEGDFLGARSHLEDALAIFDPARDGELASRFTADPGVLAMAYLAHVSWALGEVDLARRVSEDLSRRMSEVSDAGSLGYGHAHRAGFELTRGDSGRAAPHAKALAEIERDHEIAQWQPFSIFFEGWIEWHVGDHDVGLRKMRRGVAKFAEMKIALQDGLFKSVLAKAEGEGGEIDAALSTIESAIAVSERTGQRTYDAEIYRTCGEILLKQNPADPAPAEHAFLTAIAIAQAQKTRSFELRAALALAKLYRATGRDADAHAVLLPALEGFAPTPEFPEIAEAQALLTALADNEEVKAEAARRQRLTQLNIAYGNALFAARGPGAPETTEAFAKARESASGDKDASGRLGADYGLWVGSYTRGDLPSMRAHVAVFLSDVEVRPDSPEACVAHRAAGMTCWFAGEYRGAHDHLERALSLFRPVRDDDLAFRFGWDPGVAAMASHAFASWPLGEVDRGISLIDRMQTRAAGLNHVGTLAFGKMYAAFFELMRGDHARAAPNASELARLAQEHELPMWRAFGVFLGGWATAVRGAPGSGLEDMRRGVELLREQNAVVYDGLVKIALAEAEARAGDPDRAVAILDEALATADRTGYRAFEAELHRTRGEILLQRDPTSLAPAEEAFQAALAVAKRQSTRSFELRAALALAKLYRATSRDAEARAVLRPALEGFAPTPEFPEIAEAVAFIVGA